MAILVQTMHKNEKIALITGAKGGIGTSLCSAFRSAGYFVVGTDRLQEGDADCDRFICADIAKICKDVAALQRFRDEVMELAHGTGLTVLVNNAAVQITGSLQDIDYADWALSMDTNLIAPAQLTRIFQADLATAGGSVINMASVHAKATKPGFACYATTKSALVGLTRALAVELGGSIRVNAMCPAAVNTPMLREGFDGNEAALARLAYYHPIGRIAEPSEIASVALFLASPDASFVTGAVLDIDGAVLSKLSDPGS